MPMESTEIQPAIAFLARSDILYQRRCESLNIYTTQNNWSKKNFNLMSGNISNQLNNNYANRRPSLHTRIQDGKNMQLCYNMNEENASSMDDSMEGFDGGIFSLPPLTQAKYNLINDTFSPDLMKTSKYFNDQSNYRIKNNADNNNNNSKQQYETTTTPELVNDQNNLNWKTTLRDNVCSSLKNICEESKKQFELENRRRSNSPITRTIKSSLEKIGVESGNTYAGRKRMNRSMLTKMNTEQLETIINDLHEHVEGLNEQLMKMLMERDELHMKRDSILVDIEDLTSYLDGKQSSNGSNIVKMRQNVKTNINMNHLSGRNGMGNSRTHVVPGTSPCTKSLISGLRFNRLTSYIRN